MKNNDVTSLAAEEATVKPYRWIALAIVTVICVLAGILYLLLQPAPNKIVMSVGNSGGIYRSFATQYATTLAKQGITLELHQSSGAVENYQRLRDPNSPYDVALIQSGIGDAHEAPNLRLLASVSYEPLWLFYRSNTPLDKLSQLTGKRIGIGIPGSGLHRLTLELLAAGGTTAANSALIEFSAQNANNALRSGEIDAAFFIGGPESPLIESLFNSDLRLMSFSQADAMVHKFPSLSKIIFPRGAINLARDLPPEPITLLSTTALLVVKDTLHPSLIYALLDSAFEVHGKPSFFSARGEFPNQRIEDFTLSDDARNYFKSGKPFLQNYLPFWLANLIEQQFVVIVPLIAALFALLRAIPYAIDHRTRSRLAYWYGSIQRLDDAIRITPHPSTPQLVSWQQQLDVIDTTVHRLNLPRRHFDQIVALKLSIHLLKDRLRRLAEAASTE